MAAIIVRNIPEHVHRALRQIAEDRHQAVETLVRETLTELVRKQGGIDFAALARNRAALGLREDGPVWNSALDDPALSRKVLGRAGRRPSPKKRK